MPKLKHLAIRTEDAGKLASFYMDVFDMQILHKDKKEGGAIYLTDGYFNLAILPIVNRTRPTVCIILASKLRMARRSSRE